MIAKFLIPAALVMLSASGHAAMRIKCEKASDIVAEGVTLADYDSFLRANKIIAKTSLSVNYVEQFKNEFEKFPGSLQSEMLAAGNWIHIMEGSGVTVDPTWVPTNVATFDGRPWSQVPGSGGSTAREYSKSPTRMVINHLYENHGSVNLFLHEHGHSLDSINSYHGISHSQVWTDLLASEPNAHAFLTAICGSYCTKNVQEGFAELLANYHACDASRDQMESEVPRIAEFFSRFKSTKNLDRIWEDQEEVPATEEESAPEIDNETESEPDTTVTDAPEENRPRRDTFREVREEAREHAREAGRHARQAGRRIRNFFGRLIPDRE